MNENPAPFDLALLLRRSAWVRALARSLVADEATADDVVQDACALALTSPPRSADSLSAWLKTVIRRLASRTGRSSRRREIRERAAARPERIPSAAAVVELEAERRRVVEAVLDLEEPYLSTILSRFFEGLAPRQIATIQNVPVATVQTRIRRGLARLRENLDCRHGGDGRSWMLAVTPLAGLTTGVPHGIGIGAFIMTTKAKLAVAVLLIGSLTAAWLLSLTGGAPRRDIPIAVAVGETPQLPPIVLPPPTQAPGESALRSEAARGPTLTPDQVFRGHTAVRGRVVDPGGNPISGASVRLLLQWSQAFGDGIPNLAVEELRAHGLHGLPPPPNKLGAMTGEDGSYAITGIRGDLRYRFHVKANGYAEWLGWPAIGGNELGLTRRSNVIVPDIILTPGVTIVVRALDEDGSPIDAALIHCGSAERMQGGPGGGEIFASLPDRDRGLTGPDGCLSFCPGISGPLWILARDAEEREGFVRCDVVPSTSPEEPLDVILCRGEPLDVRVASSDGTPLPGLAIQVSYRDPSGVNLSRENRISDESGSARFDSLPPLPKRVMVYAPGGMPGLNRQGVASVRADADARQIDVILEMTDPLVRVRFLDAATGAPVPVTSALVVQADFQEVPRIGIPTRGLSTLSSDRTEAWIYLSSPQSFLDPLGEREPTAQVPAYGLIVDAPGYPLNRFGPFEPGDVGPGTVRDLRLVRGFVVTGVVRDASGGPIPAARVFVMGPGQGRWHSTFTFQKSIPIRSAICDEAGQFRLGPLGPGPHEIVARAEDFVESRTQVDLAHRDLDDVNVVLAAGLRISGTVTLLPDERPGQFVVVARKEGATDFVGSGLDAEGRFESGALEPARYSVLAVRLDFFGGDAQNQGAASYEILKLLEGKPSASVTVDLTPANPPLVLVPYRGQDQDEVIYLSGRSRGQCPRLRAESWLTRRSPQHRRRVARRASARTVRFPFKCPSRIEFSFSSRKSFGSIRDQRALSTEHGSSSVKS